VCSSAFIASSRVLPVIRVPMLISGSSHSGRSFAVCDSCCPEVPERPLGITAVLLDPVVLVVLFSCFAVPLIP
jgi:hypothetical protein